MKNSFALLCFVTLTATSLWAQDKAPALKLAKVFGDHMVLQQGKPTSIFGHAAPNASVTIKFAGQTQQAKANGEGEWLATLSPLKMNKTAQVLSVTAGKETVKVSDILVGEVWMCSGQSNMGWRLRQTLDWEKAAAAAKHPQLRLFTTPTTTAKTPQRDVLGGEWQICSPETAPDFSGVGYYFGRKLLQELDVPIGMVNTAWGGKPSEAFTSREMLEGVSTAQKLLDDWDARQKAYEPNRAKANYEKALAAWEKKVADMRAAAKKSGKPVARFPRRPATPTEPHLQPNCPSAIYNQMISPWNPVAIAGAIWYQGESNATRARQYETIFPAMIQDWRNQRNDAIPFHFVQLANFRAPSTEPGIPDSWAELQNAQTLTLQKQAKTGMAIINDVGEAKDIHPRNKKDVGERLARWALAKDYGKEVDAVSGPIYANHEMIPGGIRVNFDHTAEGLSSRDGKPLGRFEI
ncbi:MAG: sialate O-acetylesterase, partial [Verrucomicrobiota bacterium]